MAGEVFGVAADGGWGGGDQFADDAVHGGAAGDFLGGGLLGDPQREVGLVVLAPLEECAGGVDEQAGLALGDGDRGQVDAAGHVHGGPGVPEGDGDVDPVKLRVGGAEGGPAQVAVYTKLLPGVVGFGEQVVGGGAVALLGGGHGSA